MRSVVFLALAVLSSCATAFDELFELRYAESASHGAISSAGRPTRAAEHAAHWQSALSDMFTCRVAMRTAVDAARIGALELAAANAIARGRGSDAVRWLYRDEVAEIAAVAREGRARPSGERCAAINGWAARIANAGRRSIERARADRVIREEDDAPLLELLHAG